jgi:hypothetical protein
LTKAIERLLKDAKLYSKIAEGSAHPSNDERPTNAFIVTEVYLPGTTATKPNGAGVRTLAVFNSVGEVNAYAGGHVRQLQHLATPRRVEDGGDDEFRGAYQGTPIPDIGPDGEVSWTVEWQNISILSVERQVVYDQSANAPVFRPMSECTVGGEVMDEEENKEEDERVPVKHEGEEEEIAVKHEGIEEGDEKLIDVKVESTEERGDESFPTMKSEETDSDESDQISK